MRRPLEQVGSGERTFYNQFMIHLHWGRRQFLLGVTLSLFVATESMSLSKYSVRQAINLPGIRKAMKAILKPSLLIPQISVKSVNELDFQEMKDNGISCIVFDKDNTLRLAILRLQ